MRQDEFETPWGTVALEASMQLRNEDRQSSKPVAVPTGAGVAMVSFHVDPGDEAVPAHLRAVAFAGYVNQYAPKSEPIEGGSSLSVGGANLGWRAQAYIDPMTGDIAEGRAVEVSLVEHSGKAVRGFAQSERSVGEGITAAFQAAAEADPGLFARLYATLLSRHVADLDDGVKRAAIALEEATTLRDRAAALVAAATESAEGHQAPSPGR